MATRIERLRRRYPRLLVAICVVAIVVNLGTLFFVRVRARPVWKHGGGDLAHLIVTDDQTTAWRFGIYAELGRVGRGGVLVVPEGSWVEPYVAERIAGMTVEERPGLAGATVDVPPSLRFFGLLQYDSEEELALYWILAGPSSDVFWLAEVDGGFVVVPATLQPVPEADEGG